MRLMHKKLSLIALSVISGFLLISMASLSPVSPQTDSPTSWADLSKAEKIEAFTHMIESGECSYKGIKLHGKVEFVESFPDFTIEYVSSFPDINVKFVSNFPDDCGEWQEVTSFPDFKVKVVKSFPDLKVKKVDNFPGMN